MGTSELRSNMQQAMEEGSADSRQVKATVGTVEAPVVTEAKTDPMNAATAATSTHKGMSEAASFSSDTVSITDDDRDAFLDALVTGGRYERPFSIFGGRITGVFRCRKVAESDGILSWLSSCISNNSVSYKVEYATLMRSALLAAQVKSLRGAVTEDFPELPAPYAPTRSADGKSVSGPGWLGVAKAWESRPEALVTALHGELQEFERKYWTMVMHSADQNFWDPAASI